VLDTPGKSHHWGKLKLKRDRCQSWSFVNTNKQVGDADHVVDHVYVSISFMKMNKKLDALLRILSHRQPLRAGPVERSIAT
jgi:hypothetical protein